MDQLTSMRTFAMIASQRSFIRAAEKLNLAPSVISKQLSALEKHLGILLVERTTRVVKLTEVGELYLARCKHILAEVDDTEAMITKQTGQLRGTLKLNAPPGFAHRHIAPHLALFLKEYPDIIVDMTTAENDAPHVLTTADIHIKISETHTASGILMRVLASNRRMLTASPDYLAEHGVPETVEELNDHQLVTLDSGHRNNDWHFRTDTGALETFRADGHVRLDNGDALLRTALNGGGLCMLPSYIAGRHIASGALMTVMDTSIDEHTPLHALWRENNHRLPKIQAFLDFLTQIFGKTPYWDVQTDDNKEAFERASK
ncbi:LysR family transcriptional regulator [Alphaproteobacteria bacterium]|nr:LysR family transcriptional regulator [Alphaproteobacteria bacterium]